MKTPLYDTLKNLAEEKPLRLHIPGHKGKELPYFQGILPLDFTEITPTGNLYEDSAPFSQAQALWAEKFGFAHAQFLTGGSTQSIYTAIALAGRGEILLDRSAHRSAVLGCGFLGLQPHYLTRPWISGFEVVDGVQVADIRAKMEENPQIRTVFITSPTLHGVMSDIPAVADLVHEKGGTLIVDGAHGAHLPWLGINHYEKADFVAISAHKTLPALGQASILLYQQADPHLVGETASLFGTSSPSYLIASSMDLARNWMDEEGGEKYCKIAQKVAQLREKLPSLCEPLALDPTRLCLLAKNAVPLSATLEQQGIYLEMANRGHLVAVCTALDEESELDRLANAVAPHLVKGEILDDFSPPTALPEVAMTIQSVISAKKITVSMTESLGKIAAANIAPYPPGVPVVVMGEKISQESLDYFQKIGYHQDKILVVATDN